jgi:hypothetical protein
LKPGNGSVVGRPLSVIVSPIFASLIFLMFATRKPTSPTPSSSSSSAFGVKPPTCSDS